MGREPVPAAELDARKAVLIGGFGRAIETTDGIADIVGDHVMQGVPLDEIGHYVSRIAAVDPAAVQAAAAALLDPDVASIVVVGDAKTFIDPLRRLYPSAEVIPETALDLDAPALRRP